MTDLQTEAGRALLTAIGYAYVEQDRLAADILAIEAQARHAALAEVRRGVEGLPQIDSVRLDSVDLRREIEPSTLLVRSAVLAILDAAESATDGSGTDG